MDREYLEDYEQREIAKYNRLVKNIQSGKFSFEKDRYPPDGRFTKLQKPVAQAAGTNIWAQIPFCSTLLLFLGPVEESIFEKIYCSISEIPKIINFIKDTGRLQVVINGSPLAFERFDFMDPFFEELSPPVSWALHPSLFWSEREIQKAEHSFHTLGKIGYFDYQRKQAQLIGPNTFSLVYKMDLATYLYLKLGRYAIVEEIETLMVDEPLKAFLLLGVCHKFIVNPFLDIRCDIENFRFDEIVGTRNLPLVYQPKDIRFPIEVGKFLLRKLTYVAQDMRACLYLMDNYDDYDLQRVQESLNEAIFTNHPDIVTKSAQALSEILDNIWKDQTIPKRIENIKIGVPVSIAAVGGIAGAIAGGLVGGPGGAVIGGTSGIGMGDFLIKLGFKVGEKAVEKFFRVKGEQVSEKIAEWRTKSYQANVYDFKKKYKERMVKE